MAYNDCNADGRIVTEDGQTQCNNNKKTVEAFIIDKRTHQKLMAFVKVFFFLFSFVAFTSFFFHLFRIKHSEAIKMASVRCLMPSIFHWSNHIYFWRGRKKKNKIACRLRQIDALTSANSQNWNSKMKNRTEKWKRNATNSCGPFKWTHVEWKMMWPKTSIWPMTKICKCPVI